MPKTMDPTSLIPEFAADQASTEAERAELSALFERLGALPEADPSSLAPGRARLLASVTQSSERFSPLFGKLTQFFDLSTEALRAVFTRAADEQAWQPGPLPWVSLFHLDGGPAVLGLDAGLVRLKKGMPFPRHRHVGQERVLVLEGGYHDHDQRWYGPGALHDMPEGSEHALHMGREQDVLLAVILSAEIQIVGA